MKEIVFEILPSELATYFQRASVLILRQPDCLRVQRVWVFEGYLDRRTALLVQKAWEKSSNGQEERMSSDIRYATDGL